jgi:hypothetical protein
MVFTTLVTIGCVLGTPRGAEAKEHSAPEGGDPSDDQSAAIDRAAMILLAAGWISYNVWFFGCHLAKQLKLRNASSYIPHARALTASRASDGYKRVNDDAADDTRTTRTTRRTKRVEFHETVTA